MQGARFNPPKLEARDSIHRSCRRAQGSAEGTDHHSYPRRLLPSLRPSMSSSAHPPPVASGGAPQPQAPAAALAQHRWPLQVLAQLAAAGRGGKATPLLPPALRSADINPVVQHRVPKISTPPPDVFTYGGKNQSLEISEIVNYRLGPTPWQRACPPTLTFSLSGRSHHDLAAPLVALPPSRGRNELIAGH